MEQSDEDAKVSGVSRFWDRLGIRGEISGGINDEKI
jgi:hypothetical protein